MSLAFRYITNLRASSTAGRVLLAFALLTAFAFMPAAFAAQAISANDEETITIDSAPEMDVISFSKSVIIKSEARSVLVFGGDIVIEGRVHGDVAAIGGNVTQKEGSFIGGDVIVVGGKYSSGSAEPLRGENKQTIIFAAYEQELRDLARDPTRLFAPSFSVAFFAQRVLSVLFWFLVSLGFAMIAPGAVSRAVSRLKLSSTKVIAIGFFTFVGSCVLLVAGFAVLPGYLNAVLGAMALVIFTLSYTFGRVALQVSFGKLIKKHLFADRYRSEALAVLFGVLFWTLLLSLPYVWTLALLALFSAGVGLILTAGSSTAWKAS